MCKAVVVVPCQQEAGVAGELPTEGMAEVAGVADMAEAAGPDICPAAILVLHSRAVFVPQVQSHMICSVMTLGRMNRVDSHVGDPLQAKSLYHAAL